MTRPPPRPKIYHITHVGNLARIAETGWLLSDRLVHDSSAASHTIGMSKIKRRRLEELEVACHRGTRVGDYVPFYFCPRSVMLYVIHKANHPELAYQDGQGPIVHLEADLHEAIRWAGKHDCRWAFSLSNAGAYYAEFRASVNELTEIDWAAIDTTDFRPAGVQDRKQAEFLMHGRFPFELITRVGVHSNAIRVRAIDALASCPRSRAIEVRPEWYF